MTAADRPAPPVPAAEDVRGRRATEYARAHGDAQTRTDFLAGWDAALDAAGVPALREQYESRDRDANAWQARAEAAEAEVERLRGRVHDLRHAVETENAHTKAAEQQVADLTAERERHALANDGCVPGAAYRDLAAAHADLRGRVEALVEHAETQAQHAIGYSAEGAYRDMGSRLNAALAGDTTEAGAEGHVHTEPGCGCQTVPRYAMLDVWMALGLDPVAFEGWANGTGYADAWAWLCAQVRERDEARQQVADLRGRVEALARYEYGDGTRYVDADARDAALAGDTTEAGAEGHHPDCYQIVGVPAGLPADLCDCRTLRMIDAKTDAKPWCAYGLTYSPEHLARCDRHSPADTTDGGAS